MAASAVLQTPPRPHRYRGDRFQGAHLRGAGQGAPAVSRLCGDQSRKALRPAGHPSRSVRTHTHTHPVLVAPGAAVVPAGVPGCGPRVCGPPPRKVERWRLPRAGGCPRTAPCPGAESGCRSGLQVGWGRPDSASGDAPRAPRVQVPEFQAGVLLPSVTVWGDLGKVARHEPSTGVRGLTKGVPEGAPPTVKTPGEGAGVDRGEDPCGTPRAWTSALRAREESVSAAHQTPGFR